LDLYVLIAIIVIAVWLVSFLVYLVISNRQLDIESEIHQVDKLLDDEVGVHRDNV
jgi:hypothetical protein